MDFSEAYLLGNGPSLKRVPDIVLDSIPTFGSNRIFLKHTPTIYACVNPNEARKYPKEIEGLKCFEKYVTDKVPIAGCIPLHSTKSVDFSLNPTWAVNEGYTISYILMQIAFFHGVKTLYLLGMDHKYIQPNTPNAEITWQGKDVNHFCDDYVQPGDKWNCADLKRSEIYFKKAKQVFEMDGRRIINLTEGSALDVFERRML